MSVDIGSFDVDLTPKTRRRLDCFGSNLSVGAFSNLKTLGRMRGKDKVTVLVESYRFYGIKLPFLFHKVTVFGPKLPFFVGPKLPFFVGPKLPFILSQSYRFWDKVTVYFQA